MKTLRTDNLVLRPFEPGDSEDFAQAVQESAATVGVWMPWWTEDYSEQQARLWFDNCQREIAADKSYDIGVFLDNTDLFVGGIGINRIDRDNRIGNIGYWVRESQQNKSICSRAVGRMAEFGFSELGLVRLEIVVLENNTASRRVAEKCGAVLDCIAANRLFHEGQPMAAAVYALFPE